jgi:surface antigen
MKTPTLFLLTLSLGLMVISTGCTKREQGTVVGGVLGGALGNQFGSGAGNVAMTAFGAIAGAYIGGQIGDNMDETDRLKAQQALENTRTNESYSWRNPDSGTRYRVTPTRTYRRGERPCREYTTRAIINGRTETVHGTACRAPDGAWVAS